MSGQAVLLPNGEQTFLDANGVPLNGGSVFFYIPTTTTFKNTWQDPGQAVLNTNPVILDTAGRAIIYGSGSYRQVVKDSLGNLIWDQLTQGVGPLNTNSSTIASASTTDIGTAGSNFVTISGTTTINSFGSSASTSSPLYFVIFSGVLTINQSGAIQIPGSQNLTTIANGFAIMEYLGSGNWIILQYSRPNGQILSMSGGDVTLASASTTDLGTTGSNMVSISGTATISSFGSSASTANPLYFLRFTGVATLTNNATSLILPGGANIQTVAGAAAIAEYLGSGNWRVLFYSSFSGSSGGGGSASIIGDSRNSVVTFASNTTLTMTVDEVIAKTAIGGTAYLGTSLSSTLNFGSTGANGLDTGAIAASTFYGIYWIFNPTSSTWASLASLSFTAPTLPSGYTAFALVSVAPTNATSQIVAGFNCFGREVSYVRINIFNGTNSSTSLTSASIAAAVPSIAKTANGIIGQTTGPNTGIYAVASSSAGSGLQEGPVPNTTSSFALNSFFTALTFIRLQLITAQTLFWQEVNGSLPSRLDITGFGF